MSNKADLFVSEATRLVREAQDRDISLRIMGAVAFRIHCPKFVGLIDSMNRPLTDLDFMSYSKHRVDTIKLFKDLGYTLDQEMLILSERLKFHNSSDGPEVDVFMDKLRMSHTINFANRLSLDSPTISLADLLLEKMQIVQINEKDIKDTILLLREHAIGSNEPETIDSGYIASVLANDWGFYYTVTTNLKRVVEFLSKYPALSVDDTRDVSMKVSKLLDNIEGASKSMKWKMRSIVGTRSQWYENVEGVQKM